MSREILFRGKNVDNGVWVEGYLSFHYVDGVNADGFIYTGESQIYCQEECESYDVFTKTVGQYTGLKDKNGRKIFEGDILRGKGKNVYEVVYPENIAGFVTRGTGVLSVPCMNYGTMKYYEIIGNIHDNPELLGVE